VTTERIGRQPSRELARIPDAVRAILACPQCHGSLQDAFSEDGSALVCVGCMLRYPVREGLPVLLVEQADRNT
jgi:uncharacterized protein YbaR (Trm112 family)